GRVQAVLRAGSDRILDIVEVEGVTAVVTRFMLEFVSFRAWIDEVSPAPIRSTEVATPPYLTPPSSAESPRSFAAADLEETIDSANARGRADPADVTGLFGFGAPPLGTPT